MKHIMGNTPRCDECYFTQQIIDAVICEEPTAPTFGQWKSVKKSMPKKHPVPDNSTVDVWISILNHNTGERAQCKGFYDYEYGKWYEYDSSSFIDGEVYEATHWMYLPEPPKGENNEIH